MKRALLIAATVTLATVAGWHLLPAIVEASHCCGEQRQRVEVEWEKLFLAERKSGEPYGEVAISVEEALKGLRVEPEPSDLPSVVWVADLSDKKTVDKLDGAIFKSEDTAIALMRFRCYRVDVREIPEGDLKKRYAKEAPSFYFFDPAAKPLTRVTGKQARSLSSFSTHLEKTWAVSFTMKIRTFRKEMREILDRRDKLQAKRDALDKKAERLDKRPNPALKKQIEAETEELEAEEDRIYDAEEALIARCTLRPEFRPDQGAADEQ